jgi:hypothetical protein
MSVPVCAQRRSPRASACPVKSGGERAQESCLFRNELNPWVARGRRSAGLVSSVRRRTGLYAAVKVTIQSTSAAASASPRPFSSNQRRYQRRKINVSQVFAGQKVGVKQTDDHIWTVTFMEVLQTVLAPGFVFWSLMMPDFPCSASPSTNPCSVERDSWPGP